MTELGKNAAEVLHESLDIGQGLFKISAFSADVENKAILE